MNYLFNSKIYRLGIILVVTLLIISCIGSGNNIEEKNWELVNTKNPEQMKKLLFDENVLSQENWGGIYDVWLEDHYSDDESKEEVEDKIVVVLYSKTTRPPKGPTQNDGSSYRIYNQVIKHKTSQLATERYYNWGHSAEEKKRFKDLFVGLNTKIPEEQSSGGCDEGVESLSKVASIGRRNTPFMYCEYVFYFDKYSVVVSTHFDYTSDSAIQDINNLFKNAETRVYEESLK